MRTWIDASVSHAASDGSTRRHTPPFVNGTARHGTTFSHCGHIHTHTHTHTRHTKGGLHTHEALHAVSSLSYQMNE